MLTLQEALDALPHSAIKTRDHIAERVANEYKGFVEPEDLTSEWLVWLAEKPSRSKRWHYESDDGVAKFSWRSFKSDVARVMLGHGRKERLRALGYNPDDALEYGIEQIKDLLKFVWEDPTAFTRDAEGEKIATSTPTDPLKQPDKMIAAFDIRAAYHKVIHKGSTFDQTLAHIYRDGLDQDEVADLEGVSQQLVSKRHRGALEAIHREVNGIPDVLSDGPGTRKVRSNRAAIATTHAQTTKDEDE